MSKVYIITDGSYYKIGKAEDPKVRLKQLQTGNPSKLELIYEFEAYDNAFTLEAVLHSRFANTRKVGEWFALGKYEMLSLKQFAFMYELFLGAIDTIEGKAWYCTFIDIIFTPQHLRAREMSERIEQTVGEMANMKFKIKEELDNDDK